MNIVIGSGVAGVSAAKALVDKGQEVTILDTGLQLEEKNQRLKDEIGSLEKGFWSEELLCRYTSGVKTEGTSVAKKLVYGSTYVYEDVDISTKIKLVDAKMIRSFSRGGFSNVWGACMLPYPEDELTGWPISQKHLAPYYLRVLEFMPHVGEIDGLADRLPLFSSTYSSLERSGQIQTLHARLMKNKGKLQSSGIKFGASRLAVDNREGKCAYCGLCLYGCPYGLIYSSQHTLAELRKNPLVTYLPSSYVKRFEEKQSAVVIHYLNTENEEPKVLKGERVFLAAGVIETARIVLESLEIYDKPVIARHSDRFVLPFLTMAGTKNIENEAYHTLSQLFIELTERKLFQNDVHLQIYGYNDLLKKALLNMFGPAGAIMKLPLQMLLGRLLILFGYIHSDQSSRLSLTLNNDATKSMTIRGISHDETRKVCWRVMKHLAANSKMLGGLPIWPFIDPPGGGNHTGGTFPMSERPTGLQSDLFGKLSGLKYVHLVDASVFPSLPAATIVLSVMANAFRIADSVSN